jgi:hypothetical protein
MLHYQKGAAIGGMARIDYVNDRRMLKRSQELPFLPETIEPNRLVFLGAEQFHGYPLLNLSIGAFRQIDGSHTPAPNHGHDPVASYDIARRSFVIGPQRPCHTLDGVVEIGFGARCVWEQRLYLSSDQGVRTFLGQELSSPFSWKLSDEFQQSFDFRIHASISRRSQA